MHRYQIVARISLILSILNIVLAAPIVVQKRHEVCRDVMATTLKKWHGLGTASHRPLSPRSPPDALASPHLTSLDELMYSESDYPSPYYSSEGESEFGESHNAWMFDTPIYVYRNRLAAMQGASFRTSSSGSSEMQLPELQAEIPSSLPGFRRPSISESSETTEVPLPERLQEFTPAPASPPSPPPEELAPPPSHRPSSSGSSENLEMPLAEWLRLLAFVPERPPSSPPLQALQESAPAPESPPSPPLPASQEFAPTRESSPSLPHSLTEYAPASETVRVSSPPLRVPASEEFAPTLERPPSPLPQALPSSSIPQASPYRLSSVLSSSDILPLSPQHTGSDRATTKTNPPPDQFTPSHHSTPEVLAPSHYPLPSTDLYEESMSAPYSSASDRSLSSLYFSASGESSPSPSSPKAASETPPDNGKFSNKDLMKKIGIAAAVAIVGGAIVTGIVESKIKHHKQRDGQDS